MWLQLQADIFGRPVYPSQAAEATGRGAALLAGIGAGIFKDAREAVDRTVQPGQAPTLPRPEAVALLRPLPGAESSRVRREWIYFQTLMICGNREGLRLPGQGDPGPAAPSW